MKRVKMDKRGCSKEGKVRLLRRVTFRILLGAAVLLTEPKPASPIGGNRMAEALRDRRSLKYRGLDQAGLRGEKST